METINGRIDIAQIYLRVHDALDSEDLAFAISRLLDELAADYHADTGARIGQHLIDIAKNNHQQRNNRVIGSSTQYKQHNGD